MTKINPKLWMGRVSLISLILLCSLFMNKNAFSIFWKYHYFKGLYNHSENSITFSFLFHQYSVINNTSDFLHMCDFFYSDNKGRTYTKLITVSTTDQKSEDQVWILIHNERAFKNIQFFTTDHPTIGSYLPEGKSLKVDVNTTKIKDPINNVINKLGYLTFKWKLDKKGYGNYYMKLIGKWIANNRRNISTVKGLYSLDNFNTCTNTQENIPSELSDNAKIGVETDAVKVTGVEPGENIKVYTSTGVEVKSLVATDDAINIQLPMNHIYIVKAGQTRYRVAL